MPYRADRRRRAAAARAAQGAPRRGVAGARDRRRGGERRARRCTGRSSMQPDVAFLDIRMPVRVGPRGRARSSRGRCHVVFVTAYDEYAVAGFDEGAVDYVLKPVTAERIAKVVAAAARHGCRRRRSTSTALLRAARAARRRQRRRSTGSAHRSATSMQMIAVDDVVYFQAEDKYTKVVTRDARGADQEADQGALRRARPGGVLADPSRHDRQPARDRARRARLARPARDHRSRIAPRSSPCQRTFAHRFKAM